jgi:hypothetical protein
MPVSLRITYEDAAKSARLIRVEEGKNLAQLRTILIDRKLMEHTDAFVVADSIVDDESEFQVSDLPAPISPETVKAIKLRSNQKPTPALPVQPVQALTVQSDRDEQDSYPVWIDDDLKEFKLLGLRTRLGSWLDKRDRFLNKQKVVINDSGEGRWLVSAVADNGIIRVRKAAWSR